AFNCWKPEMTVPAFPSGRLIASRALLSPHSISGSIGGIRNFFKFAIRIFIELLNRNSVNSLIATDPQVVPIIFQDVESEIIVQSLLRCIGGDFFILEAVQAGPRSDPERSIIFFVDGENLIA